MTKNLGQYLAINKIGRARQANPHTAVCVEQGLQGVPALPAAISLTNIIHPGVVGNPTKNGLLTIYSVNNVVTPCPLKVDRELNGEQGKNDGLGTNIQG